LSMLTSNLPLELSFPITIPTPPRNFNIPEDYFRTSGHISNKISEYMTITRRFMRRSWQNGRGFLGGLEIG
ncbi:MAG: hypothetical protein ACYSWQ_23980, partial [Planctomycetota bacterium]